MLSLGIHEAAHAWVAYRCGDTTAKDMGRMTLDPISHIDPFMTIVLPLVLWLSNGPIFGGAKPVPVNPYRLRNPARDMMFVALAGPASNFLIAIVLVFVLKLLVHAFGLPPDSLACTVVWMGAQVNCLLAAFNMLPVPPLDGSRVMAYLLRGPAREAFVGLERFGMLIIFGLLIFGKGIVGRVLWPAIDGMMRWADNLTGGPW